MSVRWRACCLAIWVIASLGTAIGCNGASTGKASDAGDAAAPPDAGLDESNEGSVAVDSNVGPDAAAAGCHPGSLSGFQPPPFVPSERSAACNGFHGDGGLVQAYGDSCIGHSSTYDACAAQTAPDDTSAAACFRCLVSQASPDASDYGPAVVLSVPEVNYTGCLLLLDPTDAGASCAQAFTSAAYCADYVCKSACPPVDEASFRAYQDCFNEATTGACASYFLSLETCMVSEQGDGGTVVGTACFGGATIEDDFLSIAKLICGGD